MLVAMIVRAIFVVRRNKVGPNCFSRWHELNIFLKTKVKKAKKTYSPTFIYKRQILSTKVDPRAVGLFIKLSVR